MSKRKINRILALFLSLVMVLSLLPTMALAGHEAGWYEKLTKLGETVYVGTNPDPVTSFKQDDNIVLSFPATSVSPLIGSVFLVSTSDPTDTHHLFLESNAVTTSTGITTVTLAGLWEGVYNQDTNTETKGDAVPAGTYYFDLYDDAEGASNPELASTHSYTVSAGSTPAVSTPTITTASLDGAVVGTAYTAKLAATAGTGGGAITWSVTSGTLPVGLSLAADGAITGTPTEAGAYSFTVTAAEAGGGTASKVLSIAVTRAQVTVTPPTYAANTLAASASRYAVYGVRDDSKVYLYEGTSLPAGNISADAAKLAGCTKIVLTGTYSGSEKTLAEKTATFDGKSIAVALTDVSGTNTSGLVPVSGFKLMAGESEVSSASDYWYQIENSAGGVVALPGYLTAGASYSLNVYAQPYASVWREYAEPAYCTALTVDGSGNVTGSGVSFSDGVLSLALTKHEASITLSGKVKTGETGAGGVTVTATQYDTTMLP